MNYYYFFNVYQPTISALIKSHKATSCVLSALRTAREKYASTECTCSDSRAVYWVSKARAPPRLLRPPRDHIASLNRSLDKKYINRKPENYFRFFYFLHGVLGMYFNLINLHNHSCHFSNQSFI